MTKLVDILQRTVQSRDEEIDRKDSVINNLIKDSLSAVANNIHLDKVENDITEDLDIDGLFDEDLLCLANS